VNSQNGSYESTPLDFAASKDQDQIAKLLIKNGAKMELMENYFGYTPLHRAAVKGSYKVCNVLISSGADINSRDNEGKTPLQHAIFYKHNALADLLRQHGGVE
jgi:ankyrin repeat protein